MVLRGSVRDRLHIVCMSEASPFLVAVPARVQASLSELLVRVAAEVLGAVGSTVAGQRACEREIVRETRSNTTERAR